jgi:hypothetical protein
MLASGACAEVHVLYEEVYAIPFVDRLTEAKVLFEFVMGE